MKVTKLLKLLQSKGYERIRQNGSHIILNKPGIIRPLVIVYHNQADSIDQITLKKIMKKVI